VQIDFPIFDAAPAPFRQAVVEHTLFSIHADRLLEFLFRGGFLGSLNRRVLLEATGQSFQGESFPLADLVGMHVVLRGNLGASLFFLQNFLDNLSLEGGRVVFSRSYSPNVFPPLFVSKFLGPVYSGPILCVSISDYMRCCGRSGYIAVGLMLSTI
jgi:hypothetical protein